MSECLSPGWPAPAAVGALTTTRRGGVSTGPWASLNLGERCGDDPAAVAENRRRLAQILPARPYWLRQVHGCQAVLHGCTGDAPQADAVYTTQKNRVCAILTADCLPVLLCNRQGDWVGAAHAGWRGLSAGVLEATVKHYGGDPAEILAWLGPGIGPLAYEVGSEVRAAFLEQSEAAASAFTASGERWLADLYALARQRLQAAGVVDVYGGDHCTFSEPRRFFSHRRDGPTGRMASLIWLR